MDDSLGHQLHTNKKTSKLLPSSVGDLFFWSFAAIVTALAVRELDGLMADDGFIYWRVARNFVDHGEFTFNLGVRGEVGVTSIAYTLLLSAGWLIRNDMWSVTIAVYVVTTATNALLCLKIGRLLGHRWLGASSATAMVISPWILSTRGLESSLVALLLTAMVFVFLTQRIVFLGVLIGLVPLIRMDAALLALLLIALHIQRQEGSGLRRLVVITVPTTLFSFSLTFLLTGRFLPNTLSAKMAQGRSGFWGTGFQYAKGIWKMPEAFNFNWWFYTVVALAIFGIGYLLVETFEHRSLLIAVALFGIGHYLIYGFVLRTPVYHWYYVPELWAIVLLGGFGFSRIVESAKRGRDGLRAGVGLVLALSIIVFGFGHIPSGYSYKGYDEAGDWLRRNTPRNATVASAEIGVIGWSSRRTIIDFLGLLDERSVDDLKNKDLTSWIYRTKPDYFVTHEPRWHFEKIVDEPWFSSVYTLAFKSSAGVNIFQRSGDVPSAPTP